MNIYDTKSTPDDEGASRQWQRQALKLRSSQSVAGKTLDKKSRVLLDNIRLQKRGKFLGDIKSGKMAIPKRYLTGLIKL